MDRDRPRGRGIVLDLEHLAVDVAGTQTSRLGPKAHQRAVRIDPAVVGRQHREEDILGGHRGIALGEPGRVQHLDLAAEAALDLEVELDDPRFLPVQGEEEIALMAKIERRLRAVHRRPGGEVAIELVAVKRHPNVLLLGEQYPDAAEGATGRGELVARVALDHHDVEGGIAHHQMVGRAGADQGTADDDDVVGRSHRCFLPRHAVAERSAERRRARVFAPAWPVRGRVISRYGPNPGGLYNDGINIAAGLWMT